MSSSSGDNSGPPYAYLVKNGSIVSNNFLNIVV